MNDIERLIAIEDIKALMAQHIRCLDENDWDGFTDCYAPDAVAGWSETGTQQAGNKALAERNAKSLAGITTVHQVHTPEITIESETDASAIWPLNNLLLGTNQMYASEALQLAEPTASIPRFPRASYRLRAAAALR
jgi:hypothetical protein